MESTSAENSTVTDNASTSSTNGKASAATPEKPRQRGQRGPRKRAGAARKTANGKDNGKDRREERDTRPRTFPTVKVRVEIDHDIVKGAFKANVDHFRSSFFHVTSVLGRYGMESEMEQVHGYVVDMIEGEQKEIKKATAALASQIKDAVGSEAIPRTSNNREVRETDIPSFVVRKYIGLFQAADRLVDAIVYAETAGVLSWHRRSEMLRDIPKYLRTPAGRFKSIASQLHQRQKASESDMAEAKAAMVETIEALLETHKALKPVERKRPLAKEKPVETKRPLAKENPDADEARG